MLVRREDRVEDVLDHAHCADALVCVSNCDKITPGMLMAALRPCQTEWDIKLEGPNYRTSRSSTSGGCYGGSR